MACPLHGWTFALRDGYCEDIMEHAVRAYEVRALGGGALCVATEAAPQLER